MKESELKKQAMGIVNQLFDLAEVPVEKRQEINDKADEYITEQLRLCGVSQQRELLAISCLRNITDPIKYLRDLADKDDEQLDVSFAMHLTRQGMFYQNLAKEALKEIDNCG